MEKILVEVKVTSNDRRILRDRPDVRLLERLVEAQGKGTTGMLAAYLAQCREDLHQQLEIQEASAKSERQIGACMALSDLIGLLNDPRKLLELTKKAPTR